MRPEDDDGLRPWGQPSAQDTGTQIDVDALAQRLAEAARSLQKHTSPQQVMDDIVRLACAMVPGAQEATITMVGKDRHCYSAWATSTLASDFDVLQDETGEGPLLDAIWHQQPVRVNGVAGDPRWPVFGPGPRTAECAAIAAADAQHFEHVSSALVNRDVIGQAKGILMERFKTTSDQAFVVLAKVSQESNCKLVAVDEELARTGVWAPGSRARHDRQDTPS